MVKLMETLSDWLLSLPLQQIPYQAVLDLVDNKMKVNLSLSHTPGLPTNRTFHSFMPMPCFKP